MGYVRELGWFALCVAGVGSVSSCSLVYPLDNLRTGAGGGSTASDAWQTVANAVASAALSSSGSGAPQCTHFIFVSWKNFNGSLAGFGVPGADSECAQEAGNNPPTNAWIALLPDNPETIKQRFTIKGNICTWKTNKVVATPTNWLVPNQNHMSLIGDPNGNPSNALVWTGSNADGTKSADCAGWTNMTAGTMGMTGAATSPTSSWLANMPGSCTDAHPIYCVSQPF